MPSVSCNEDNLKTKADYIEAIRKASRELTEKNKKLLNEILHGIIVSIIFWK